MSQELFDWALLILRWVHITTAIAWIGTSLFFMWLDRSLIQGELWMLHGGGFYHVKKMQLGPTKVPERLHWFKWEAYWTWMSGMGLMALIFYTGEGSFLLDDSVSKLTFNQGILLGLFSILGSWFVYDLLWESKGTQKIPLMGHIVTILWVSLMSYLLCHKLSGRAAYMHIGAMLGTWMAANVFLRIIPRQIKMVEATIHNTPINPEWSANAKNRSTHNTYLTLPVIFIMLSNHFPSTYGHDFGWLILLLLCLAGAAIREFFILRLSRPRKALGFAVVGILIILALMFENISAFKVSTHEAPSEITEPVAEPLPQELPSSPPLLVTNSNPTKLHSLRGEVRFEGIVPENKKLHLPAGCHNKSGKATYSNEILVQKGKIQNALLRITKGHENLPKAETPAAPVEVNQIGCIYEPRVVAARVGQEIVFINSDPTFHNVRSFSKENPNFNLSMPLKNQRISKRFLKPEIFLETKCSVHPWMSAYIAIMDHPFFDVSDSNGEFNIQDLPQGTYTLEVWHEVFGTQTQEIIIGEEAPKPQTFVFKK